MWKAKPSRPWRFWIDKSAYLSGATVLAGGFPREKAGRDLTFVGVFKGLALTEMAMLDQGGASGFGQRELITKPERGSLVHSAIPRTASVLFVLSFFILGASPSVAQFSGYYLELSAGPSETELEILPPLTETSVASNFEAESNMLSLMYGLRFNDNLSVEVGYTDYGSFSGPASLTDTVFFVDVDPVTEEEVVLQANALVETEAEYEATALTASLVGNWPLSRRWNLFGKLGLAAWKAESEFNGSLNYSGDVDIQRGIIADFSDSGSSFFYSAGLSYRFNLSYGVKLEYQRFNFESSIFSSDADIDSLSVGVRLYF